MFEIYYKYQQDEYSFSGALAELEEIDIPEYDRINTGLYKGRIYIAMENSSMAVSIYEELFEFADTTEDKRYIYQNLIPLIRRKEDNIDEISCYLEEMVALDPSFEREYLYLVHNWIDLETSYVIFEQYVNRHLFSKHGWVVLGFAYSYCLKYKEAIEALNKAIALSYENDMEILVFMGDAYKGLGKKEVALECYQEAILIGKPNKKKPSSILSKIADLYFETGQLKQSAYYYNLLIEENPKNQNVLHHLGMIYYRQEEYDLAIHYLERARKENMEEIKGSKKTCNDMVLSLMSKCMIAVDRSDEMIEIYERMSKYLFYDIGFWLTYSDHYAQINKYEIALYILDKGMFMPMNKEELAYIWKTKKFFFEKTVYILYRKANYYFLGGYTDCGLSCLRMALTTDPHGLFIFLDYDSQTAVLPEVIEIIEEFNDNE